MVGSVCFPLSLLGLVLGTSKVFGLGKELAFAENNKSVKIEFNSYVGTGVGGESNPNSLTFSSLPVFFGIYATGAATTNIQNTIVYNDYYTYRLYVVVEYAFPEENYMEGGGIGRSLYRSKSYGKRSGNTLFWYCTDTQNSGQEKYFQCNENNIRYYYFAIY